MNRYRLTDICDFQGGSQPPKSQWKDTYKNGYIRMLQIRDFTQKTEKIEYVKETNSIKKCSEDDILIARYGASIGKILTGLEGAYNVAIVKTIPNSKILSKTYLYYYLNSSIFQKYIKNVGSRAAQAGFNKKELNKLEIDLPTLDKQKIIVENLQKIQNIISNKEYQIAALDNLIKSLFVDMFNKYEKIELHFIANIVMGQSPKSSSYNNNNIGTPFFQGKADYGDKYTIIKHWTTKPCKLAQKGNVLMSVRAPVGPVNIASHNCCIGRGLCAINSKPEKANNEFLYNALKAIQNEISSIGTGSTFKAITKNEVYNIKLPNAPIEKQDEFTKIVNQIDKQKFEIQNSLNKMKELYETMMNKYFG